MGRGLQSFEGNFITLFFGLLFVVSAIMRDEAKLPTSSSTSSKPIIYLFTACGKELCCIRVRDAFMH